MIYNPSDIFEPKEVNLGEIPQGKPVTARVKVNLDFEGIPTVKASCGCTKPTYDSHAKTIAATYNAAAEGDFDKTVTFTVPDGSGGFNAHVFHLKGRVV